MSSRRGARGARAVADDDVDDDFQVLGEDGAPITGFADVEITPDPVIAIDEPAPAAVRADPEPDAFEILQREAIAAKQALAAERQRNQQLEARSEHALADVDASNLALLNHAANQSRAAVKAAQSTYATAMASQDYESAAAAQVTISERIAEAREFEAAAAEFKAGIDERRAAPKPKPAAATPAQTDPFEAMVGELTPASAAWMRKNKDKAFGTQSKWLRTVSAHHAAVEAGHEIDSPAYFQFLEGDLGIAAGAPDPKPTSAAVKPPPQKRAPPMAAAPVTRGSTTGAGGSVTLSKDELAAAKRLGMTPAKYGKLKHKALQSATDPDYTGPRYSQHNPAITQARGR